MWKGFPFGLPEEAELGDAEGWASKRLTAGSSDYVSAWRIQTDSGIPARELPVAQPGFQSAPLQEGRPVSLSSVMRAVMLQ